MLDTIVVDRLALNPEVALLMRDAVTSGRLVLMAPHLDRDHLARVPVAAREMLVRFVADLTVQTTTARLSLDLTAWGASAVGTETQPPTSETAEADSPRQSTDGLILATPQRKRIPLVTAENGRLWRACLNVGVEVLSSDELIKRVRLL